MFSIFGNQKPEKSFVVFDIGSASIAGAVVKIDEGNKPAILHLVRESLPFRHEVNHKDLLSSKHNVLKRVAGKIVKEGLGHRSDYRRVESVHCFLSSPWYSAEARTAKIEEKTKFKISVPLVADFLTAEKQSFLKTESGKGFKSERVIEQAIIRAELNGYPATNFIERETKSFSANIYIGGVPGSVTQSIIKALGESFSGRHITFHTFLLPYFTVVRDRFSALDSFLLADVTGEVTDLTLVEGGAMRAIASFPLGRNYFVREVTKALKTDPDVALSFIKVALAGKGEKDFAVKVNKVIDDSSINWKEHFRLTLDSFRDGAVFPRQVFLTADLDLAPIFELAVASEKLDAMGASDQKFTVNHLGDGTFRDLCDFSVGSRPDAFLAIESLYLDRLVRDSKSSQKFGG